jgi:hypothetical protein
LGHRFLKELLPLDVLISDFGHQNHQTLGELRQNDASMIINEEILKDWIEFPRSMQNAAVFLHRYNSV